MSSDEMEKIAKKIKPVIERMALELYKKKPQDVVRIFNITFLFKY